MTPQKVARLIQDSNPSLQLYWNTGENPKSSIGYWGHAEGRVIPLVTRLISGEWARMEPVCANGEPILSPEDWEPISYQDLYQTPL